MATFERRIASRLVHFRSERELSQETVAARADISTGYLSSLERCRQIPRINVLNRIAKALNVELRDLVDFSDEPGKKDDTLRAEIALIVSRLDKCDAATVRRIRKSIEALIEK